MDATLSVPAPTTSPPATLAFAADRLVPKPTASRAPACGAPTVSVPTAKVPASATVPDTDRLAAFAGPTSESAAPLPPATVTRSFWPGGW